jgi:hypothetical protein
MNLLRDFFETERKKVLTPDAFFTQRVMARLDAGIENASSLREAAFWEIIPSSTRPVLALALMLILCFIAVEVFVPQLPQRGLVESFLAPEQSPAESFLYNDTDVPSRQDVLQQLIEPEDQQ